MAEETWKDFYESDPDGQGSVTKDLLEGEQLLWAGSPELLPFVLSQISAIPIGLIVLLFGLYFGQSASDIGAPSTFSLVGDLVAIFGLFLIIGLPLLRLMSYLNTEYVITEQRVIARTGAIGISTRIIELEWIREIYIQAGISDRIFGTGSIMLSTASGTVAMVPTGEGTYHMYGVRPPLQSLADPDEVQHIIHEAMRKRRPVQKE